MNATPDTLTRQEIWTSRVSQKTAVQRITALWALSEAALGGVLHALRIPFTGLFIGSSAVVFIALIAFFGERKREILRATLLVLIIKGVISPHTPLTAFLAVGLQGVAGAVLFRFIRLFPLAALLLGIFTLLQSSLQKIVILTLVFGKNLWEALDILGTFILKQLSLISTQSANLPISLTLISVYIGFHLMAGIIAGILAGKLPQWIKEEHRENPAVYPINVDENIRKSVKRKKRRPWWKRISGILIFCLSLLVIIFSYLFPDFNSGVATRVILMLVRSTFILLIWYFFVGPLVRKFYQKFISSRQRYYGEEIETILAIMPLVREIVKLNWKQAKKYPGLRKYHSFLVTTLTAILTVNLE
ncbi:MAG: hypothetical protein Kow0042_14050 [Calditrichia bacterium]